MNKPAPLPKALYRTQDVRELDRLAIEEYGIPAFTLMRRAGEAAFRALRERWPEARRVLVFCGGGNNGGDGYVIAALARAGGLAVQLFFLGDPARLGGAARQAYQAALARQVPMQPFDVEEAGEFLHDCRDAVVVDALLGTGLQGEVRGHYRDAIACINASGLPVLAVDIPSGLDSDNGAVPGEAVRAELTMTFIALKLGLYRGRGPEHCGDLRCDDLQVPAAVFSRVTPAIVL